MWIISMKINKSLFNDSLLCTTFVLCACYEGLYHGLLLVNQLTRGYSPRIRTKDSKSLRNKTEFFDFKEIKEALENFF